MAIVKRTNLLELELIAGPIAEDPILIRREDLARILKQLDGRVVADPHHSTNTGDTIALDYYAGNLAVRCHAVTLAKPVPSPSPVAAGLRRAFQRPRKAHDPLAGFGEPRLGGAHRDAQMTGGARAEPIARQDRNPFGIEQAGGEG